MKAVILNALYPREDLDLPEILWSLLAKRGWEIQILPLKQMDVKPCSSCGCCSDKNPGRCSIKDDMEQVYAAWANSQLVIFCTPISFGGYHSDFKLVQDRFMPLYTGLFCISRGELHFQSRYRPTPALMTVGLLEESNAEEQQAFQHLTERNAINFLIDRFTSVVVTEKDEPEALPARLEQALKEVV